MSSSILNRIVLLSKEPSTFAGIAGVLGASAILGLDIPAWTQILTGIGMVAGVIATVMLDNSHRVELGTSKTTNVETPKEG